MSSGSNIDGVVQRLAQADGGMDFLLLKPCARQDEMGEASDIQLTILSTDLKSKLEAAAQLRDGLEHYTSGAVYPAFLKRIIPILVTILKGQPVFISTSVEQVCIEFIWSPCRY